MKSQYDRAKCDFEYLFYLYSQFKAGEMPTTLQNKSGADRFKADTALRPVFNRKPELKIAEVHGILAELKNLKHLKKIPGKYLTQLQIRFYPCRQHSYRQLKIKWILKALVNS